MKQLNRKAFEMHFCSIARVLVHTQLLQPDSKYVHHAAKNRIMTRNSFI